MISATALQLETAPDYEAIKQKQRTTWATGDYGKIGSTLQITGENLCEALDLRAGQTVLDVAAGNGNASLAAARRFCKVLSTDYVPELLEQSQARARASQLPIDYQYADAEALPFHDAQFDNVISTFGVMFAPDQNQCAAELIRVCRPGGKIGLANWTPDGFIGQLFKLLGQYIPPPAGVQSPARWGTHDFIEQAFRSTSRDITIRERDFVFRYASPEHWLDVFRTWYGPTNKAFAALDRDGQQSLAADILALIGRFNRADDQTMVAPSRYLEIVITRRAGRSERFFCA